MEKKMMKAIALILLLVIISSSSNLGVESSAFDCLDSCDTGCVQSDTRLMQRCERKCQIKCGPDQEANGHLG